MEPITQMLKSILEWIPGTTGHANRRLRVAQDALAIEQHLETETLSDLERSAYNRCLDHGVDKSEAWVIARRYTDELQLQATADLIIERASRHPDIDIVRKM